MGPCSRGETGAWRGWEAAGPNPAARGHFSQQNTVRVTPLPIPQPPPPSSLFRLKANIPPSLQLQGPASDANVAKLTFHAFILETFVGFATYSVRSFCPPAVNSTAPGVLLRDRQMMFLCSCSLQREDEGAVRPLPHLLLLLPRDAEKARTRV